MGTGQTAGSLQTPNDMVPYIVPPAKPLRLKVRIAHSGIGDDRQSLRRFQASRDPFVYKLEGKVNPVLAGTCGADS